MKVTVRSTINPVKMTQGIRNNTKLWTFAASEWWRLLKQWTPQRTGALIGQVRIEPKRIIYFSEHAKRVYYDTARKFRTDLSQFATARWDVVARPIQQRKLIKSLQDYIQLGGIDG